MDGHETSTLPSEGRRCANCGAELTGTSAASPCPWCHRYAARDDRVGLSSQVATVPADDRPAAHAASEAPVRYRRGERRWVDHWRLLVHQLARLESAGGRSDTGPFDLAAWATAFFAECDQLADWLQGDVRNLPGLDRKKTAKRIARYPAREQPLQQCRRIATAHDRYRMRGVRAGAPRIVVRALGDRWHASVESGEVEGGGAEDGGAEGGGAKAGAGGPVPATVDVVALAKDCIASWRRFFAAHEIEEPGGTAGG